MTDYKYDDYFKPKADAIVRDINRALEDLDSGKSMDRLSDGEGPVVFLLARGFDLQGYVELCGISQEDYDEINKRLRAKVKELRGS